MLQLNGHDENMTPLPVEDVHEQAGELSVLGQANLNESGNTDGDQGVLSGSKLHLLDLPAEILKGIAVQVSVSFRDGYGTGY